MSSAKIRRIWALRMATSFMRSSRRRQCEPFAEPEGELATVVTSNAVVDCPCTTRSLSDVINTAGEVVPSARNLGLAEKEVKCAEKIACALAGLATFNA